MGVTLPPTISLLARRSEGLHSARIVLNFCESFLSNYQPTHQVPATRSLPSIPHRGGSRTSRSHFPNVILKGAERGEEFRCSHRSCPREGRPLHNRRTSASNPLSSRWRKIEMGVIRVVWRMGLGVAQRSPKPGTTHPLQPTTSLALTTHSP